MSWRALSIGLLACLLGAACQSVVAPLRLPDDAQVMDIEAWPNDAYDFASKRILVRTKLTATEEISSVMSVLRTKNQKMEMSAGTFPTPTHTLVIHSTSEAKIIIYIGADWIGGIHDSNTEAGQMRQTALTASEKAKLLKLLRLPDRKP